MTISYIYLVHGNYSNWQEWSECSVACGNGTMIRRRSCTNPIPSKDEDNCESLGPQIEMLSCSKPEECRGKVVHICVIRNNFRIVL